jgi:hypothetical protein
VTILRNALFLCVLIGFTIPKSTFRALIHLHEFAEHYHHHNQVHGEAEFLNFIVDHFITKDQHDHADEEHHPFNHNHSSTEYQNQVVVLAWFDHSDSRIIPEIQSEKTNNLFCNPPFTSDFVSNIWQPPKKI